MKYRDRMFEVIRAGLLIALSLAMLAPSPAFAQSTSGKLYHDAQGGFFNETNFVTSAAYTATGGGTVFADVGAFASGSITINVTAVSGTSPTLVVNFKSCYTPAQTSVAPALSACVTKAAWQSASITATGVYIIPVDHYGRWVTADFTIGGTTPSFTFAVVGQFKPTS